MTETNVILYWVQAGAALWLAFILQLVYRRIHHEQFLHFWSLSFAVMGVVMMLQLAILPSPPPPELFTSTLLFLLGTPQLPLIVLAVLSLKSPVLTRRKQAVVFGGILAAVLLLYLLTEVTIGDPLARMRAQRFERLVLNSTAHFWFCAVFWRRHYLARSVGGRVVVLFTALRALHYSMVAATIAGIPIYPAHHSSIGDILAAVLPFGIASGVVFMAAEAMTQTNKKLRESESRYRLLAENTSDTIWLYDLRKERFTYMSPTVERESGYTSEEVMSWSSFSAFLLPDKYAKLRQQLAARIAALEKGDESARFHTEYLDIVRKDGSTHPSEVSSKLISGGDGRVIQIEGVNRDISERRNLEAQLLQAQKMESVGRLAGGIAHDFNNILQVIKGYSAFVISDLPPQSSTRQDMEQVVLAVERAQNLVRQLLIFSRRERPQKKHFALGSLVAGMINMLRRVIGEDMHLTTELEDEGQCVFADSGQIEQALLNLCINAKDAMPQGGTIRISTKRALMDAFTSQKIPGAREGSFIALTVADHGTGMSQETLDHIFEPFFTTKEIGRGTGLGLSMVYGIVKEHDGFVHVESKRGAGSVFSLYFPEVPEGFPMETSVPMPVRPAGGNETILLVEDDRMVRAVAARFLKAAGYRVLEARDGAQAVEIFAVNQTGIQLVILDLVMPNLGGKTAGETIRKMNQTVPILYSTGYDFGQLDSTHLPETNGELIQKPYSREDLLLKVRQVLDHPSRSNAPLVAEEKSALTNPASPERFPPSRQTEPGLC
jgi:PAS domain S-box-containing protein